VLCAGYKVSYDSSTVQSMEDLAAHALNANELSSVSISTDAKTLVGFQTLEEARLALAALTQGQIPQLSLGTAPLSTLSVLPSFVVEVEGVETTTSVRSLLEDIKKNSIDAEPIRTDRNAIVKFKRHSDVSGITQ
jgi:hypothetical protein